MTFFAVLSISTLAQAAETSCKAFDLNKKTDQEIYQNLLQGRQVPNSTMSEETVRPLDLVAGSISSGADFSYVVEFCNNNTGYKIIVR
jgi:hypothetical protein